MYAWNKYKQYKTVYQLCINKYILRKYKVTINTEVSMNLKKQVQLIERPKSLHN